MKLSDPFPTNLLHFKPIHHQNNRALCVAFIDARTVMDRLDEVLSPENWTDRYKVLTDGSVKCNLTCKLSDAWITKSDVGSPSEQPDEGDRLKAAFSDALKRAAVKFGIGRYLYRLPALWVEYDSQKKAIKGVPNIPDWALPKLNIDELSTLLRETETDPQNVLNHFQITDLNALTPEQHHQCLKMLKRKKLALN